MNPTGTRIGLVDFSGCTDRRLILGLSGESQTIQVSIDTLPFFGNDTYTVPGLSQAQAELEAHGRAGVNRAIILITDGEADDGPDAIRVAANSKAAGTKIFAIGVTARINFVQLQQIASEPVSNTVFTVDDFAGLSAILQQLIINVCPPNPAITITNRANVIAIESDSNSSNNTAETATVVLQELPRLSILRADGIAVVSWPDWATPIFLLEATQNLLPVIPWTTVTDAPLRMGTRDTVSVDSRIGQSFYRLRSRP